MSIGATFFSLTLASAVLAQTYTATYTPSDAPKTSEQGQSGTNQCGSGSDQTSMCQNVYVNSLDDWCVFAPPEPGADSTIGNTERIEVAWCVQGGHGTRVIPDGTVHGAHFVQTPDYVQVTGVGDFTQINIAKGDEGGELDPHGADGKGNPIGGLVFSNAYGSYMQMHEWTNFMAADEFCIRACKDGPDAPELCQHIYDVMGCYWNMPGDYSAGSFDSCRGDSGEPMGVYGTSTFHQGQASTPSAHPAPAKSQCSTVSTIGNGMQVSAPGAPASSTTSGSTEASSAPASSATTASSAVPSGSSSSTSSGSGTAKMSTSRTGMTAANGSTMTSATSAPTAPSAPTNSGTAASSTTTTGSSGNGASAAFGASGLVEIALAGAAVVVGAFAIA